MSDDMQIAIRSNYVDGFSIHIATVKVDGRQFKGYAASRSSMDDNAKIRAVEKALEKMNDLKTLAVTNNHIVVSEDCIPQEAVESIHTHMEACGG